MKYECQHSACTTQAVAKMIPPNSPPINVCDAHAYPFKDKPGFVFLAPDEAGLRSFS